jgi:hypothetical protein
MTKWERAFWVYPWDLVDEGIGSAFDQMQRRAGATMINIATIYHAGKFLHPHNPKRKVVFPESGTFYFTPTGDGTGQRIEPPVWPEAAENQLWEQLRHEVDTRGLGLTAWVLCLHNSGIGSRYPDCTVRNVYGEGIVTDLCARNPDIRSYLTAALGDIAATVPVDRILLESLEYMPFQHGYHHEVVGVPTGPAVNFLMSLCFCIHCQGAFEATGEDFERVQNWVRSVLNGHFEDPFASKLSAIDWPELRNGARGSMGAYLDSRQEALTSLLRNIVDRVRAGSSARIALADFGPLFPSGADGRAWENGVNLATQLPLVEEVHPAFYFTDLDVHKQKVDAYLKVLAAERPMHPAIRAILPQTTSPDDLAGQLRPLAPHAAGFSFYNYGFMALQVLDWIGEVVDEIEAR